MWLVNGQALYEDKHEYLIETISFNTQRLTIFLNKKNHHFNPSNYTCRYQGKESSILVRRRTKEELHRLPRQEGSSTAYLYQSVFGRSQTQYRSLYKYILIFFVVIRAI